MGSILRLGVLVLLMFVVGSARAEAGFWDWLEELNGPGPSTGWNFMLNVRCTGNEEVRDEKGAVMRTEPLKLGFLQLPKNARSNARCLFFDFRNLHAKEDERFFPVDVTTWGAATASVSAGARSSRRERLESAVCAIPCPPWVRSYSGGERNPFRHPCGGLRLGGMWPPVRGTHRPMRLGT